MSLCRNETEKNDLKEKKSDWMKWGRVREGEEAKKVEDWNKWERKEAVMLHGSEILKKKEKRGEEARVDVININDTLR